MKLKGLRRSQVKKLEDAATLHGFENLGEYLWYLHDLTPENRIPKVYSPEEEVLGEPVIEFHKTKKGKIYQGDSRWLLHHELDPSSVDLIVTSPPFGLLRKKEYGNESSDEYVEWFRDFAVGMHRVLKDSGSLVIDIGGTWKKGRPVRSLYHFSLLKALCSEHGFRLAQEFYWWNPAKLPTPAEWVNIRRIRVRDSVNCVWWLSKTDYPKASNRRVLQPYSQGMKRLHSRGKYNSGGRPSGHAISEKAFLSDNGGSIPHNLIALANTRSSTRYQRYCRKLKIKPHPARFPAELPAFFIKMLTDRGDTVLDPFGGSCVTGAVAEEMDRKWICGEMREDYLQAAMGWFTNSEHPLISDRSEGVEYIARGPAVEIKVDPYEDVLDPFGGRKLKKGRKAR